MSQGVNIPDIDRVVQWKLPATFSNFIQRAGRAARGRGCNGLAVLLVEKPAYNVDLVTDSASTSRGKKKKKKHEDEAAKLTKLTPEQKAERSEYARAHGLRRGSSKQMDDVPDGDPPRLDPESSDEGLLTFVQSTTCRRKIWAQAFESPLARKYLT